MLKKLNICFTTEDFYPSPIGGQGVFGLHLVSELAKQGLHITVLAENRKGRREFWYQAKPKVPILETELSSPGSGLNNTRYYAKKVQNQKNWRVSEKFGTEDLPQIKIILLPFCFGQQLLLALFEYLFFIFRFKNKYFDIVHANQLSGFFFTLFKPANAGKIIISVHNTNYDLSGASDSAVKKILYQPLIFLEKLMYRRADGLLFHSDSESHALLNYFHIKNKPTAIAYIGVDRHAMRPLRNHPPVILTVSRLVKRKKIDMLLKALEILNAQNIKTKTMIIGDGPERKRLGSIAPSNVSFIGTVRNDLLGYYYRKADLFVLPSLAEGGVSLASLEAASFGLPLILSSEAAGIPILKEGVNGYIVSPDDPYSLAAKIKLALKNSVKMGKAGLRLSHQFSWRETAQKTSDFYRTLL